MRTKIIISLFFAFIFIKGTAQTEKGKTILSGKFGFSYSENYNNLLVNNKQVLYSPLTDTKTWKFSPNFGYFVIDNLAVVLSAEYQHINEHSSKTGNLILMPTLMYYFPVKSYFRPYIKAGVGYNNMKMQSNIYDSYKFSVQRFNGTAWGASLGTSLFINKRVSLDAEIQYAGSAMYLSGNTKTKITGDGFGFLAGFSVYL